MTTAAIYVLTILSSVLLLPAGVLFLQCLAAAIPARREIPADFSGRPMLGILVPAHNEAMVIAATLQSIQAQLAGGDRLLVVADNCSDDTAAVARAHGAEVLVRHDAERRGKGFALTAGLQFLADRPPAAVVIIDADCLLAAGCLDALAQEVQRSGRPVQGCYLMPPPANPRPNDVVSSLAVLVKNKVRPLGMWRMGLPCLLTGSGAAFPWGMLSDTSFTGGHIVEDMQLAVDLAREGKAPQFCPRAELSAPLPTQRSAFLSQRTRWEHGHLQMLLTQGPRLLAASLRSGRTECLALMLDLCVPPLSLLTMIGGGLFLATAIAGLVTGCWTPAIISLGAGTLISAAIGLAWAGFGRSEFPFSTLLAVPWYMLTKLPMYFGFLYRRQTAWIRTGRNSQS